MGERRTIDGGGGTGGGRRVKPGKLKKALRAGVTTVFRLTMGSSQSHDLTSASSASASINANAPPLRFHQVCGDNIHIEAGGFRARRVESFCKGIVFSDRPVALGEKVALRLTDLSSRWSGVIRLGFTGVNPAHMGQLPKYACPDLTSKPGYWAKALSERYPVRPTRLNSHMHSTHFSDFL